MVWFFWTAIGGLIEAAAVYVVVRLILDREREQDKKEHECHSED